MEPNEAEQKFRVADEARWERTGVERPEAIDVATSFGPTRVNRWAGPGADIVLLHGLGDTSIRWAPFAPALADHNIYAVDVMGEPGQSVQEVPFESAEQYGPWLAETIAGLGLAAPHIVGHSLGGYIALSHAVAGGSASSFVLLDPVGVVKLRVMRFLGWNAMLLVGGFSPGPIRRWFARRLRQPVINDKADFRMLLQSQRDHPPKPMPIPVATDAQLASIDRPVRLLAGAKSSSFKVSKMVERITDLVPGGNASLVADAGHALVLTHFDECVAEIHAAVEETPEHG